MEEVKNNSLSGKIQASGKKSRVVVLVFLVFGLVITLGILSYMVLFTKSGFLGFGFIEKGSEPALTKLAPTSILETSPTPRPKGSGIYACSPSGVCNEYDDPKKEEYGCPVTFADRLCLDSCNDLEKRCAK